ncbi:MAG TPA: hypothetical protein DEO85_08465 [Maritimibacter sp.]|nr:hypothetical protein [Maritimibacter sp.]
MADASQTGTSQGRKNIIKTLEFDTRLLGMVGAFILVCLVFNILTDGRFLTPRNIFNLTIQTVSVAIMATGMVFVIVTRHIDLSVGALLATCSAVMAMTQTQILPSLGIEYGSVWIAPIAIAVGILTGGLIGAFHGWLIGYLTIPAFIVTLGGFLVWRNVAWYLTNGQTIGPLDETFQMLGGIGGTAFSPIVNPPEVAILGITRTETVTVWNGDTPHPVPMVPLDLSYDHRVINGADAARFLSFYTDLISDPRNLMV